MNFSPPLKKSFIGYAKMFLALLIRLKVGPSDQKNDLQSRINATKKRERRRRIATSQNKRYATPGKGKQHKESKTVKPDLALKVHRKETKRAKQNKVMRTTFACI